MCWAKYFYEWFFPFHKYVAGIYDRIPSLRSTWFIDWDTIFIQTQSHRCLLTKPKEQFTRPDLQTPCYLWVKIVDMQWLTLPEWGTSLSNGMRLAQGQPNKSKKQKKKSLNSIFIRPNNKIVFQGFPGMHIICYVFQHILTSLS